MIRDPSDGSVREAPPKQVKQAPGLNTAPAGAFSGLPSGSARAANQERLERSRNWLKDYFAKRGKS